MLAAGYAHLRSRARKIVRAKKIQPPATAPTISAELDKTTVMMGAPSAIIPIPKTRTWFHRFACEYILR